MRHRKKGRKLNRTASHRKAMLRNMVTTFLDLEQIETTDAKAKELRPLAERLVTLAKREDGRLAARRSVLKVVRDRKVVAKLFDEIGPRYADRPGGYTRIVKVTNRRGDAAPLSVLQFVTEPLTFKERRAKTEEDMDDFGPLTGAGAAGTASSAAGAAGEAEVTDQAAPADDEGGAGDEGPTDSDAAGDGASEAEETAAEEEGEPGKK